MDTLKTEVILTADHRARLDDFNITGLRETKVKIVDTDTIIITTIFIEDNEAKDQDLIQ